MGYIVSMSLLNRGDAMAKKKNPYDEIEQSIDIEVFVESVKEGFNKVLDPRRSDNQSYPLTGSFD